MHFTYDENGQIVGTQYSSRELLIEAEKLSREHVQLGYEAAWNLAEEKYKGTIFHGNLKSFRFLLGLKHGDAWPKLFVSKFREDGRETLSSKFMKFAIDLASSSTCERRQVGTVITDARHTRILCVGYNGNYCGGPNRCENPNNPGSCGCIHAEQNSLIKSSESLKGAICYVTLSPCRACAKLLINAEIGKVIYFEEYRDSSSLELLRSVGVEVEKF